jgi:endonuclease-3
MSKSKSLSKKTRIKPSLAIKPMGRLQSLVERQRRATKIFTRLAQVMPEPRCELHYKTPYQLLISVVLSAQTTDKSVNKCMAPLYDAGLTPEQVVAMGAKTFESKIKTIGLAPTKAKNVIGLTQILLEQFGGKVPDNREDLEALPGVGRKTANVVLAEIFHQPTLAVDTHVFRVGMRLGLHAAPTPQKAELILLEVIDPRFLPAAHHWLILHGRYTCKAAKPDCPQCKISDLCPSFTKL